MNELKYYANFPSSDALSQSRESKEVSGQVYDVLLKALERSEHDWLVPITVAGVKTTPDVIRETILPKTVARKMNWSADIAARGASYKFLSAQLIRQRTEKW